MTDYRRTTPDVSAAQYAPTADDTLAFTDKPDWLETAIEIGVVIARNTDATDGTAPYIVLQAQKGVVLVEVGDWIVKDRWDAIHAIPAATFATDYELFPATADTEAATK